MSGLGTSLGESPAQKVAELAFTGEPMDLSTSRDAEVEPRPEKSEDSMDIFHQKGQEIEKRESSYHVRRPRDHRRSFDVERTSAFGNCRCPGVSWSDQSEW